ncbi:MAG: DNA polymerase I, partial [candidate division Zixibacteria bacterium]|nr:DNA polymerase I [candidate division Zixibacteria bacterium]
VHTTFNQTIAATGRLSSTDPNLQNIPIRTEIGREIRKAFVPKDQNYRILTADYSQIELRILASVSGDKNLIKAFKKGEDIHNRTAAEVYGVELDEVTDEQRRLAKTANFAVIYGVSAYGLSQQSDLDVSAAKKFIDTYFERYPGIQSYMDETLQFAQDKGYVETLSGRRRYIPEINAKNRQIRQFAERTAINTRIQGAAADMIKLAMIAISKSMSGMKSKMILQVHDELVFDAHVDEIDKLTNLARNEMVSALELKVPIIVDIGCGRNWLEAKS